MEKKINTGINFIKCNFTLWQVFMTVAKQKIYSRKYWLTTLQKHTLGLLFPCKKHFISSSAYFIP